MNWEKQMKNIKLWKLDNCKWCYLTNTQYDIFNSNSINLAVYNFLVGKRWGWTQSVREEDICRVATHRYIIYGPIQCKLLVWFYRFRPFWMTCGCCILDLKRKSTKIFSGSGRLPSHPPPKIIFLEGGIFL